MARRFKSLERSRRSPALTKPGANRPPLAERLAVSFRNRRRTDWTSAEAGPTTEPSSPEPAADPPSAGAAIPSGPTHRFGPTGSSHPLTESQSGHAPTGWDWFARWPFPSQLLCFSILTATGMWWIGEPQAPITAPNPTPPPAKLSERPRPRLPAEAFDWLNRLRETQVVTDQLESEFAEAQQFYREYALDEFLDFDPWSLGGDEVITLTHFCDQGFFTVEREILIKILERRLLDQPTTGASVTGGALHRLEFAARDRESRLASLREASELYHRGRIAEVTLPSAINPEEDQARRASLVDKLAGVRRERERLDARIAELNSLLR